MALEIDLGPDARAFRDELRQFLEANKPEELIGVDAERAALMERSKAVADWTNKLGEAGYLCVSWPKEFGGRGLSGVEVAVMNEEFARAGVPRVTRGMGEWLVGPSIIVWGTDEQKAHFLPRIIDGTDRYCQGFSEPDAGSDLAGLKTRGIVDGDEVVITGQKVWTSGAQAANMMFCLCRTDPDAPKHKGISYVLTPMQREDGSSNGFELRPIKQLTGAAHFTETFITEARAPLFNVIGGLHNGWRVTMTTLGNERGGNATTQHVQYTKQFWDGVELARKYGRDKDALTRQQLAWAFTHVEIMRFQGLKLLSEVVAKKEPGPASSINKMFWSEYAQRFAEIMMHVRGADAMVMPDQKPDEYSPDKWTERFLSTRSVTIWGGTAQVQRNIVGERVLGLPKEPDLQAQREGREAVVTAERRAELAAKGLHVTYWAETIPDKRAIVSDYGTRTFAQLDANANRLVRALRARGLQAGDAVALICGNRPEFAEAIAATTRGGFRITPINWHLTGDEAGYIVDDCEAKAVLADSMLADCAVGAVTAAPGVGVKLAIGGDIDGFESYEAAIATQDGGALDDVTAGSQMMYTSGTTGRPKGVYRPPAEAAAAAGATTAMNLFGYAEGGDDMHLCTGPLYHAAPLAFSLSVPLAFGCGVVLMDKWDAEEALRLVAEHKVTHTHMVPTMFHRLLSLPEDVRAKYDTSSLRHVLHGAAPCPVSVKRSLIEWLGPIVVEYYAATEGVGSFVDSNTWLAKPGTVGKPMLEGQVMIGNEEGEELPRNEAGLVFLRARQGQKFEYFKDDEKTSSTFRGDYFTLGDVGYMDDDGYLFLTDRTANLIISGGVNIYPAEVDAVLLDHPAVGDVATIGVPNSEWGEEVKAVVELQPGLEPSDELAGELLQFCRDRLASYKCPRTVDFTDALPRQDNGKIYKRLLRDRYRSVAANEGGA